jgi:hypothetical protein
MALKFSVCFEGGPDRAILPGVSKRPAASDYELSKQAMHHEIRWFIATTVGRMVTYHFRGKRGPFKDSLWQ